MRAQARFRLNQLKQERELESRLAREQAQVAQESMREKSSVVQDAMRHPYLWTTQYTETYNEHWVVEGRPTPYEPFPKWPYFEPLFDVFLAERITWIEKSRDMLVSWACVAYLTWEAQRTPYCGILFQCQKEKKVKQLINYAKCLWERQPNFLREQFPLARPLQRQSAFELEFASGAYIAGVPGGADQIRSYHPWGYLNDESSFQPAAGECHNEALSAVAGKIIFNSSAGPGWYADARRDIIRTDDN